MPIRAGTWFQLARHTVVLAPHERAEITFSGRVPDEARGGDHLAGVIAYGKRPRRAAGSGNFGFRLVSRLAIAVRR